MTLIRIVWADKWPVVKEKINAIMDEVENWGAWDMLASTYDPANGSRQVAFSDEIATLENEIINSDFSISPEGTALYLPLDAQDYDFASNTVADRWPFTKNNWTLANFTRNDGTVSGGVTIEGGAMKSNWDDWLVTTTYSDNSVFASWTFSFDFWYKSTWISWTADFFYSKADNNTATNWICLFTWGAGSTIRLRVNWTANTISSDSIGNIFDWNINHINVTVSAWVITYYFNNTPVWWWTLSNFSDITTADVLTLLNFKTWWRALNWSVNLNIYNKALTSDERTAIYNAWPNSYTPISTWLLAQYSGRDFTWTPASPVLIRDTNMIVSDGEGREKLFINWWTRFISHWNLSFPNLTSFTAGFRLNKTSTISNAWYLWKYNTAWNQRSFAIWATSAWGAIRVLLSSDWATFIELLSSALSNWIEYDVIVRYSWGQYIQLYINWLLSHQITTTIPTSLFNSSAVFRIWRTESGLDWVMVWSLNDAFFIPNRLWSNKEILAYSQRTKRLFSDNNGVSGDYGVSGDLTVWGGIELFAPNGNRYMLSVDNSWAPITTAL